MFALSLLQPMTLEVSSPLGCPSHCHIKATALCRALGLYTSQEFTIHLINYSRFFFSQSTEHCKCEMIKKNMEHKQEMFLVQMIPQGLKLCATGLKESSRNVTQLEPLVDGGGFTQAGLPPNMYAPSGHEKATPNFNATLT